MQAESQFVVEPKNIFSTEPFRREKVIAPVFFPRTIIQGLDASRIMVWSWSVKSNSYGAFGFPKGSVRGQKVSSPSQACQEMVKAAGVSRESWEVSSIFGCPRMR